MNSPFVRRFDYVEVAFQEFTEIDALIKIVLLSVLKFTTFISWLFLLFTWLFPCVRDRNEKPGRRRDPPRRRASTEDL